MNTFGLTAPLGLVVLGLGFALPAPAGAAEPAVGVAAPAFTLVTTTGRTVTLDDYRGKTLVINVWGSWCPPCRIETPDLVREAKADGASVAFLGIDTTETVAVARAFTAAKGVTYPQVVTTGDSAFAQDYGIRNYPTTFVIDPHGIVRAVHADNLLPRAQLHAYIAAAQHDMSAPLVSAEQARLDAMLDPARYPFTGDAATVAANVRAATKAMRVVDDEMDVAMTDASRDHDLIKTHAEESALRARAIAALAPIATANADRVLLADLQGEEATAKGDWSDADAAYARALATDPEDIGALSGQAYAAVKQGDDARVARLDEAIATLEPSYATYIALTRIDAKLGKRAEAFAALERATALAKATGRPALLAWTHLYGGRSAVALGDMVRARSEFDAALAAAVRIPSGDARRAMYLEQSQEATVALSLGSHAAAGVSLAPWTGPELPGAIESTLKYRLAASGVAGTALDLNAHGLPKGWIGSFCTDRVCAPFHVAIVVPPSGVKIIEFQVVPDGPKPAHDPVVSVTVSHAGKSLARTSTTVAAQ